MGKKRGERVAGPSAAGLPPRSLPLSHLPPVFLTRKQVAAHGPGHDGHVVLHVLARSLGHRDAVRQRARVRCEGGVPGVGRRGGRRRSWWRGGGGGHAVAPARTAAASRLGGRARARRAPRPGGRPGTQGVIDGLTCGGGLGMGRARRVQATHVFESDWLSTEGEATAPPHSLAKVCGHSPWDARPPLDSCRRDRSPWPGPGRQKKKGVAQASVRGKAARASPSLSVILE